MKIEEAHTALLHAATDEIVSAILELHHPHVESNGVYRYALCQGCDCGAYAEMEPDWPCSTVEKINQYLHVDLGKLT